MNFLMAAQMGTRLVSAFGTHSADRHRYNMETISREYREKMSGISFAMQSNTMTQNEISARDAQVRSQEAIQIQAMEQEAEVEAGAAAAGVSGGSVTSAMRGMMRSRLRAYRALEMQKTAQSQTNTSNRRNLALERAMNKDISPIMRPSAASALLGLGAGLIDIYDSHQAPGSTIEDTMAGWGR